MPGWSPGDDSTRSRWAIVYLDIGTMMAAHRRGGDVVAGRGAVPASECAVEYRVAPSAQHLRGPRWWRAGPVDDGDRVTELADRKPAQLSGGHCAQRVAIARALARAADLIVGRTFRALDVECRQKAPGCCGRRSRSLPHHRHEVDLIDAVSLADYVLVLADGGVTSIRAHHRGGIDQSGKSIHRHAVGAEPVRGTVDQRRGRSVSSTRTGQQVSGPRPLDLRWASGPQPRFSPRAVAINATAAVRRLKTVLRGTVIRRRAHL